MTNDDNIDVYFYLKTQGQSYAQKMKLKLSDDAQIALLTFLSIDDLVKSKPKINNIEISHVILNNSYQLLYQYEIVPQTKLDVLLQRQKYYFQNYNFIYIYSVERSVNFEHKYDEDAENYYNQNYCLVNEVANNLSDNKKQKQLTPEQNICQALRLTYPLRLFYPLSLTSYYYNKFLDEKNTNWWIEITNTKEISGFDQKFKKKSQKLVKLILRPNKFLWGVYRLICCIWLAILQYCLRLFKFFDINGKLPNQVKPDFKQRPCIAFVLPLYQFLIDTLIYASIYLFYIIFMNGITDIKQIAKQVSKLLFLIYSFTVLFQGNSIIGIPDMQQRANLLLEEMGRPQIYHYLFDELYRADTYRQAYGLRNRNQKAIDFKEMKELINNQQENLITQKQQNEQIIEEVQEEENKQKNKKPQKLTLFRVIFEFFATMLPNINLHQQLN